MATPHSRVVTSICPYVCHRTGKESSQICLCDGAACTCPLWTLADPAMTSCVLTASKHDWHSDVDELSQFISTSFFSQQKLAAQLNVTLKRSPQWVVTRTNSSGITRFSFWKDENENQEDAKLWSTRWRKIDTTLRERWRLYSNYCRRPMIVQKLCCLICRCI